VTIPLARSAPLPPHSEALDATHPLAEAHQPKEKPDGFLLARNGAHYMLAWVVLMTSEIARRYTARECV
jgi:hypothetical protein